MGDSPEDRAYVGWFAGLTADEPRLGPFRDSTIDKWGEKARMAQGGMTQTKFKALDQVRTPLPRALTPCRAS